MSFLQDKKNKTNRTIKIVTTVFVVCILTIFSQSVSNIGGSFAQTIARPFLYINTSITTHVVSFIEHIHFRNTLITENTALRQTIDEDNIKLLDYDAVVAENTALKKSFARVIDTHNTILAYVLVRPPISPFDTIVIDIGTDTGVAVDDLVFIGGNEIIGTVSNVYAHTSTVQLYSFPGRETQAIVSGEAVTLTGRGGGNFEITTPKNAEIALNTPVILPGINQRVLGVVQNKISKINDPYTKYLVSAPENQNSFTHVFVEK